MTTLHFPRKRGAASKKYVKLKVRIGQVDFNNRLVAFKPFQFMALRSKNWIGFCLGIMALGLSMFLAGVVGEATLGLSTNLIVSIVLYSSSTILYSLFDEYEVQGSGADVIRTVLAGLGLAGVLLCGSSFL